MSSEVSEKTSFVQVLEKVTQEIFNGQLTDIIEVTYAYKKLSEDRFWNETLFSIFSGFRFDSQLDFALVKSVTEKKLTEKLDIID